MHYYLSVTGAYGRKYDSQMEFWKDWEAGKDFKIVNGPYFSKRDVGTLMADGYCGVQYRTSTGVHWMEF